VSGLRVHISVEHDSDSVEVPAHFRVELPGFGIGSRYRRLVICLGELFYLTWDTEGNIFRFGVFHFGRKNKNNDFKYGIKVGNSDAYVAATRKCHNYVEGGLKKIQPSNCVTLHFDAIPKSTNEQEEYSCEIEIGKWKLDGFVSEDMPENIPLFPAICNSEHKSGFRVARKPPAIGFWERLLLSWFRRRSGQ
jgi:hypothetical protein